MLTELDPSDQVPLRGTGLLEYPCLRLNRVHKRLQLSCPLERPAYDQVGETGQFLEKVWDKLHEDKIVFVLAPPADEGGVVCQIGPFVEGVHVYGRTICQSARKRDPV